MDDSAKVAYYEKTYGPVIEKRGLHNWKNLFRKPNIYEWTILVMILMSLFIFWAYKEDVSVCQDFLNNREGVACMICDGVESVSLITEDSSISWNESSLFKKENNVSFNLSTSL